MSKATCSALLIAPHTRKIVRITRNQVLCSTLAMACVAYQAAGQSSATPWAPTHSAPNTAGEEGACSEKTLSISDMQGLKVYSPDGQSYLVNRKDEKSVFQVYLGAAGSSSSDLTCITCMEVAGGPKRNRSKMQPHWHPSGRWIFLAVEREKYSPPPLLGLSRSYVEGQLQNGIWTNMYAVSPSGRDWHQLTNFQSGIPGVPDGFSGPAVTGDGNQVVFSQIVDGNVFVYRPFGRWQLILADFEEKNGIPIITNKRDITPKGMYWNEPGNFAPDRESLLLSGSVERNAEGMDQYVLNIRSGRLTNLTNSPTVWDEHGRFSPDGKWIIFMSALPYRNDPKSSSVLSIKTEFMLMDEAGGHLSQLTHFRTPGYPEFSPKGGIAANPEWNPNGRSASLARLFFPNYQYWDVTFAGACGNTLSKLKP